MIAHCVPNDIETTWFLEGNEMDIVYGFIVIQ